MLWVIGFCDKNEAHATVRIGGKARIDEVAINRGARLDVRMMRNLSL